MQAQTLEAVEWWQRPREASYKWVPTYQQSIGAKHRLVISHIVGEFRPQSVLEVGSHCGPNLVRLATDHPGILDLCGIDVNEEAVRKGRDWVAAQGLGSRIRLQQNNLADALSVMPDRSVDVILSCYALVYIAPFDVDAVLYDIGRVARMGAILAEPMTTGLSAKMFVQTNGYQEWAHNFDHLSHFVGTWRDLTLKTATLDKPVDHLERVLVAVRGSEPENLP